MLDTSDSRTHHFKNDNELEKYLIEPDRMSWGRPLLSTRPATGRQVGTLSGELVSHHTGSNMVQGYRIDFVALPHQESQPTPPHYSSEQTTLKYQNSFRNRQYNQWSVPQRGTSTPTYF